MKTRREKHQNNRTRLTAGERGKSLLSDLANVGGQNVRLALIVRALQAHARAAVKRATERMDPHRL